MFDLNDLYILKYCGLFINRYDCYAIQDNNKPELFPTTYNKLTIDIIKDSLIGNITIGIHQINLNNKVKWLCYDFDKKHIAEPKKLVDLFIKYLKEWYNLTGYLELSGSPDSYHVWIFLEPTDSEIAIDFHKSFLNRLKAIGINIKGIEKGISKGDKGLGCMIKLPFNIQRKTDRRSEFLADIFKIIPERLPVIQEHQHNQQTPKKVNGCVVGCVGVNQFADTETCNKIIAKNPKILERINQISEIDRSGLDFLIIKCLAECSISKNAVYEFLKTVPNSKVHERGYSYFQITYDSVLKSLSTDTHYQNKLKMRGGEHEMVEKITIVKDISRIDTTNNGRMSYVGLYVKEGQYGQFFSIEKHGEDMKASYLSLGMDIQKIKEIGEAMVKFANEQLTNKG